MVGALAYVYLRIGRSVEVEARAMEAAEGGLTRGFWVYCGAVLLNTLGLIPVALILYMGSSILQPSGAQWMVPLLYVVVQLVDAPMAVVSGVLYDRMGVRVLMAPFALSILPAFLVSYGGLVGVVSACVVYGLVLGMQESIYRAAIVNLVPLQRRGTAYGVFNTALGVGTLAGGVVFGLLIDRGFSGTFTLGYALVIQAGALIALWAGIPKAKP
jgi:MFS family permease